MRALACRAVGVAVAGLLFAAPVSATLIEIDLPGGNLNEVTRDTVASLDWLDVSETLGVSFDSAIAAATGSFGPGWVHATGAQVCALYAAHALDPQCSGVPLGGIVSDFAAPFDENDLLMTVMGVTNGSVEATGFYDDVTGVLAAVGVAQLLRAFNVTRSFVFADQSGASVSSSTTGNYLVRAAPAAEPSTGLLLGLGLAAVAAMTRRSSHQG